ncbi:MAG: transcriptional regulator, partial [Proteobacteria bacterium]|nr:transcriptional regulator [Pseudomonadota bacterium]
PLSLQAKLLRIVQEKRLRRLGSSEEIELDVKIISSIGRPAFDIVQDGSLRQDLFYRLGVVFINLPPLRTKKNGLNELIQHFIAKYNKILAVKVAKISTPVSQLFDSYHWPGNVRELEHVIEASMNMVADGKTIKQEHLPFSFITFRMKGTPPLDFVTSEHHETEEDSLVLTSTLIESQAANEKKMINKALKTNLGNAAKAARSLGISPQSFHYKVKKHQLRKKDYLK